MSYVDAHVHVWTDDYDTYPFTPDVDLATVEPRTFHADDILDRARPCGVDRVVLVQMSYYGPDNRYMLETMAAHPGVFAGIGVVDVQADHPDQAMLGLAAAAEGAGPGVRGFRIAPWGSPPESWLDGAAYGRMFAVAAEKNLALCPLIGPEALPSLERRCAEFPQAPVIVDHLCRIGVSGTIERGEVEALCGLARFPRAMVKVSAFYALGAKEPPYADLGALIEPVYRAFGAERLMWASDCPYQVQGEHTYEASFGLVRDHLDFLSAAERDRILGGTAAEFFFGE